MFPCSEGSHEAWAQKSLDESRVFFFIYWQLSNWLCKGCGLANVFACFRFQSNFYFFPWPEFIVSTLSIFLISWKECLDPRQEKGSNQQPRIGPLRWARLEASIVLLRWCLGRPFHVTQSQIEVAYGRRAIYNPVWTFSCVTWFLELLDAWQATWRSTGLSSTFAMGKVSMCGLRYWWDELKENTDEEGGE